MTSADMQRALPDVRPGHLIEDIRFRSGSLAIRGLREGVVPDDSPLAKAGMRTLTTTNGNSNPAKALDFAIGIELTGERTAKVGLYPNPKIDGVGEHPSYIREALAESARICNLVDLAIDPEVTDIPVKTLEQAGFRPADQSGEMHFRAFAA